MRTNKLNLKQYHPGGDMFQEIKNCIPGEIVVLKGERGKEDILVDEKNKRIYFVQFEHGNGNLNGGYLPQSILHSFSNRTRIFTGKAMYGGLHLLDYDCYLIAAAEFDGNDSWYDNLGCYYEPELFRDSVRTPEGKTFIYCEFPYFDRKSYLQEYEKLNRAPREKLDLLDKLEKYVYQRTGIDLDVHDKNLLVYQDEGNFEYYLACVNWFHDGKPVGFKDDEDFLAQWHGMDEGLLPFESEEAIAMIENKVAMWNIDAKLRVDGKYDGTPDPDQAKDYLPFLGKEKLLHVLFTARFGKKYKGSLQFEIIHERSGFRTKWGLLSPERKYLGGDDPLCVSSQGFSLEQVLGKNYSVPSDSKDFVTVVLYHHKEEIFRKDFQIRRVGA